MRRRWRALGRVLRWSRWSATEWFLLLCPIFRQRPDHGTADGSQEPVAGLLPYVSTGKASANGSDKAFLAFCSRRFIVLWLSVKLSAHILFADGHHLPSRSEVGSIGLRMLLIIRVGRTLLIWRGGSLVRIWHICVVVGGRGPLNGIRHVSIVVWSCHDEATLR